VADDMTPGEIRRNFERVEHALKDGDDRHADLARRMVPTELWSAEHRAVLDRIAHQEEDARETAVRIEKISQERMAGLRAEIATVRDAVAEVRKAHAQHTKAHETDSNWSRSKRLTVVAIVAGAAATLVGAWIAAFAAAGGVR
jgi:hypothetical protein